MSHLYSSECSLFLCEFCLSKGVLVGDDSVTEAQKERDFFKSSKKGHLKMRGGEGVGDRREIVLSPSPAKTFLFFLTFSRGRREPFRERHLLSLPLLRPITC